MKILASDYDGTLNVQGVVTKENIEAITAWRAAGNLFGVVSGRNLGSIKKFLDKDNVPYDFMVGCNGSVMTDAEGNATGHRCIPARVAKAILQRSFATRRSGCVHPTIGAALQWRRAPICARTIRI